jgi:hypothetical protein
MFSFRVIFSINLKTYKDQIVTVKIGLLKLKACFKVQIYLMQIYF